MAPRELNFITGNKNKLAEVAAILEPTGIILRNQALDIPELQGTIEQITTDKCRRAAELVKGPVLVEDTCLCFNAFKELPGPYIKYFVDSLGVAQLHKLLIGFDDHSAQSVCTFGYCEGPGKEILLFQGRTDGMIVEARGQTSFGWDACFEYEGKTFAEMSKEEKNKISHRGRAFKKLSDWLSANVS